MIGKLRGILIEKKPPHLMLEVQGVGYIVQAPMSTCFHLPALEAPVSLHIHMMVRDEVPRLYGFWHMAERQLFCELIKVNGVGPKVALAILSGIEVSSFVHTVLEEDVSRLVRLPGVGKRTAERLIVEMRDKLQAVELEGLFNAHLPQAMQSKKLPQQDRIEDAIAALISLGYKPKEARQAVDKTQDEHSSSEDMIRRALQGLMKA
jgi:Holliday junction DNA helicase RuvA